MIQKAVGTNPCSNSVPLASGGTVQVKKVLITGANSFIGTSFERHIQTHYPNGYAIETIDMVDGTWRDADFSKYDAVFHVAGIAHADTGHVREERKAFYYQVNTDLTIETAKKAKAEGVKQFLFMSSAIVYGDSAPIGKTKIITKDTLPSPTNVYGDSKFQAENGILPLQDRQFHVVVLRPPMIYGPGCKGNYPILSKFARNLPVFPYVDNQRSMLYIENFCEFIHLMIANEEQGIFHPQNREYSNTAQLVQCIAHSHGKKVLLVKGFGWALQLLSHMTGLVNKAFGSLSYDMQLSDYKEDYRIYSLSESIERTEYSL